MTGWHPTSCDIHTVWLVFRDDGVLDLLAIYATEAAAKDAVAAHPEVDRHLLRVDSEPVQDGPDACCFDAPHSLDAPCISVSGEPLLPEIEDGFGGVWERCDRVNCGLQVVRPGKVQCWCDSGPGLFLLDDSDESQEAEVPR